MGGLEIQSKKKQRRANLKKYVLASVSIAGIIAVAAVAPNVLGAMGKLDILPYRRQKELITRSRDRLIEQGLLVYENGFLKITREGEKALQVLERKQYQIKKPKRWDKKWRILIFDIPEKRKGLREKIRRTLSIIGFVRLQDSVWVYPYDCEDVITLLKADFRVGKDMLYLIVEALENDTYIRGHFGI